MGENLLNGEDSIWRKPLPPDPFRFMPASSPKKSGKSGPNKHKFDLGSMTI